MKKILMLLVTAILTLSVAAVALANMEVRGDFRWGLSYNGSDAAVGEDKMVDSHDLRVEFVGKYTDKFVGYARLIDSGVKTDAVSANLDQYWVSYQTKYALWRMGNFEWKILPSRDILDQNGGYCMRRTDTLITASIPLPKGFSTGFAFAVDGNGAGKDVQDGAYALKFAYSSPKLGVEVHYLDTKSTYSLADNESAKNKKTVLALDTWCKPLETVKVYLCYTAPTYVDDAAWGQDPDTMFGFSWERIKKTPLNCRLEYIVNQKLSNTMEYHPWHLGIGWDFTSNLSAGVGVNNYISKQPYEEDYAIGLGCKLKF